MNFPPDKTQPDSTQSTTDLEGLTEGFKEGLNDAVIKTSKPLSKRQLAIAERESELLTIAEQLVADSGFSNFTMDKLTAHCDYSKGTVYNHFNSKEDLIVALCIKSMKKEMQLFNQSAHFDGNAREKCLAALYAYQLHAYSNPVLFMCVLTAKTPATKEKASPERLLLQEALSKQIIAYCDNLFDQGIADGSLVLGPNTPPQNLTFALWAMAYGTNALILTANSVESVQRLDLDTTLLTNVNLLLDGFNWHPLSTDWDYHHSWQRIATELFKQPLVLPQNARLPF